ncbi:hypothetical protein ACSBOB_11620 [Mesorhizobium sp. ASY16-5R]|uniref:hypothetical protein n=1 Tax=Mesorhizobium sp. ASY16-5R TaxID=3445772 RepID=UPI003F9FB7C8
MKLHYGEPYPEAGTPAAVKSRHLAELAGVSAIMDVISAASCQVGRYGEAATLGKSLAVTAAMANEMVDRIRADLAQGEHDSETDEVFLAVEQAGESLKHWPSTG